MERSNSSANTNSPNLTESASRIFFEETLRPTGEQVDNAHVEQTSQYFERLKATDPTLFETLNKDIKDLSRIFDIITSDAPELDVDGVRKFGCVQCGKTYDRKLRANDCRYSDLNLKPYICQGGCGQDCEKRYSSKELLNRHCEYDRVKKCDRCDKYLSKQNYARHVATCQN